MLSVVNFAVYTPSARAAAADALLAEALDALADALAALLAALLADALDALAEALPDAAALDEPLEHATKPPRASAKMHAIANTVSLVFIPFPFQNKKPRLRRGLGKRVPKNPTIFALHQDLVA